MPIKFRWPQDINAIRFGATLVWGVVNGIITTIQGTSPLSLVNAVAGRIKSLVQYGKCTIVDDEIYCNNGKLVAVDDELPTEYKRLLGITFDGNFRYETGEVLTGNDDVTMTLENLSSSGKNVFGSYNGANNKNFSLYIYGSTNGSYFRFGDQLKRPKYGSTGRRTITFGVSGTSGFSENVSVDPDEFTTPANVYIGMLPNSNSPAYTGDIIGSIIVSNRLEWIPCERESDGAIGYYEKYNGNFLEPVGGGTPVSLGYETSHLTALPIEGTPEVLVIGEQTASVANLFAVDDIKDEQDIISGVVTRRCEAEISDGTTPSGRYIGTVGEGNIIVKARETGYEGDVATFEATEAKPLNGLTVNVEPIQDLHGYDSPWPDGGGKNKFTVPNANFTINGVNFISSNGQITINGNNTAGAGISSLNENFKSNWSFSIPAGTYYFSRGSFGKATYLYHDVSGSAVALATNNGSFTLSEQDTVWVGFYIGASDSFNMVVPDIQLEVGSAKTSFEPVANICPISGITSATVTRTGRNLLDVSNTTHNNYNIGSIPNTLKPNAEYTFSVNGTTPRKYRLYLAKSSNPLNAVTPLHSGYLGAGEHISFTTPNDMSDFDLLCLAGSANGAGNEELSSILPQLELGSTASAYHPYQGNTYTIQLGDTIYGGTLDVTGGKMVVDRALNTFNGTETWYDYPSYEGFYMRLDPMKIGTRQDGICNMLAVSHTTSAGQKNKMWLGVASKYFFVIGIYETMGTTLTDFKAYLAEHNMQLVYPLATPLEITLTPTQIETLLGQNNVWSDAGSVKAYVADGDVIEHVTAQPLRTTEGDNIANVTSAVAPVELKIDYFKNE